MDLRLLQPEPGPQRPLPTTPARAERSVRRTTTTDVVWPARLGEPVEVDVRGQDLRTVAGEGGVVSRFRLVLSVDPVTGQVGATDTEELETDGDEPTGGAAAFEGLVGANVRRGFAARLAEARPEDARQRTLWFSALDDLPGAFLVSGYSLLRAGLVPAAQVQQADRQGDICIGWARGGPLHTALIEHDHVAIPMGPVAPAVEAGDPAGWHPLPELAPGTVRRRRQLDVRPLGGGGDGLLVQSHFRDSFASEEPEMVMHEYLVEAEVAAGGVLAAVDVDPRVLPWEACPGAAASAAGVVGMALDGLEAEVRAALRGPTTCTHLTSTLRALADVRALGRLLEGGG